MRIHLFLLLAVLTLGAYANFGQDPIGKVVQGLSGGKEVDDKVQEAYGLLKFQMGGGVCSASLLRNGWAISAAHCVDQKDAEGRTMPDPARPGQNVLRPLGPMRLTAAWGGGQTKMVTRIVTFWPYDVALIQLDSPIQVNGSTTSYAREVLFDQFPSFGSPGGIDIMIFGAGINQFATGSGASAKPSSSDDKFRVGIARVVRDEDELYWYPPVDSMIAGGDSGGPSFTTVGSNRRVVLVGVHALTLTVRVPGKEKDKGWTWVASTTEAADAPIKPVWKQIQQLMGPSGPASASSTEASTERHKAVYEDLGFRSGVGNVEDNVLYGVRQDGTLIWHHHFIDRRNGGVRHSFQPVRKVGDGWNVAGVYPAGAQALYTVDDNGVLRWLWHRGAFDGSYEWGNTQEVGQGWSGVRIIPMDKGVVYTISKNGSRTLRWQRHVNYLSAKDGAGGWQDSKAVHDGFWLYMNIFSGGNGVLYGITLDGELHWYRHKDYLNPSPLPASSWEGPKKVGDGWNAVSKAFSPGGGHIYAITPDGTLTYYKHLGYMDGSYRWDERAQAKIATGWNGYLYAFARITTSDAPAELPK